MEKFKRFIEKSVEGGAEKYKRNYFNSLYDIKEGMEVYNELVKNKTTTTINSNVARVCENCGLEVAPFGIGYEIKII